MISDDYTGVEIGYKKGKRGFHSNYIAPIGSRRALSSRIIQMNRLRNLVSSPGCHQQFQSEELLVLKMFCERCLVVI